MTYPTVAVNREPVPSDWQVNIMIEIIEQYSKGSPARLRTEFTNEATTTRAFLSGYAPPFGPLIGHTVDGERIFLIPDDDSHGSVDHYPNLVPQAPVDGCWKLARPLEIVESGLYMPTEPSETTTMTYAVLGDREAPDCLPPGEYRFEAEWGERYENDEDEWHSWGFTLKLHE